MPAAFTAPRRSLARSALWNLLGQGLPLLIGVLAIPVTVRELGLVGFGLLALGWTVVGYFNFFDLGFGRATTKRISEAVAAEDAARVAAIASASAAAQLALGVVAGAVLWSGSGPLSRLLLAADATIQAEAAVVLRLLALAVPAVLVSNSYRAVLEGLQQFDRVNVVRAPFASANYLVPLIGALLGWQLPAIVGGLVVARYAAAGAYLATCLATVRLQWFGREELSSLLRFGGWVALSNAIIPLTVTLERYVVSGLRGPTEFAYYSAPAELITRMLIIPSAFSIALFPLLSELFERRRGAEAITAITRTLRSIMLLLAPPLAVVLLFAEPLLTRWLGPDFAASSALVLRVLSIALFVNALAFIPSAITEAAGRPDLIARYHVMELPLYLALLLWIVPAYGIVGAAGAVVVRMAVLTVALSRFAAQSAAFSVSALLAAGGRAALLSGGLLSGSWLLSTRPQLTVLGVSALALGYTLAAWFWVLSPYERVRVRQRVALLIGRGPRLAE